MIKWIPFDNKLNIDMEKARFFEPLFLLDGEYLVKFKHNGEYKIGAARLIYRNVFNITNLDALDDSEKKAKHFEIKNKKIISFADIQKRLHVLQEEREAEIEKEKFLSQLEEMLYEAIEYTISDMELEKKDLSKEKILKMSDIRDRNNKSNDNSDDDYEVLTEDELINMLQGPDYMYYVDFQQMEEDSNFEIIERVDENEKYKFLLYFYKSIYTADHFSIKDVEGIYELENYMFDATEGNIPEESGDYVVEINYYFNDELRYEYRVGKYLAHCDKWIFTLNYSNTDVDYIVAYKKMPVYSEDL